MVDWGIGVCGGGFVVCGDCGGDCGCGCGCGCGCCGGNKNDEKEWQFVIKFGCFVKVGKIKSMEEIYFYFFFIKEYQIVDYFFFKFKDEVMKVCIVVKL